MKEVDSSVIKAMLHNYVETADDEQLQTLLALFDDAAGNEHELDLTEAYRRRQQHLQNSGKSYSLDETVRMVKEITGHDLQA